MIQKDEDKWLEIIFLYGSSQNLQEISLKLSFYFYIISDLQSTYKNDKIFLYSLPGSRRC